jgi:hypothetical protein
MHQLGLPPLPPENPTHSRIQPPTPTPTPAALQLATLPAHPESVPINALVAVKGTPMQDNEAPSGEASACCQAQPALPLSALLLMRRTVKGHPRLAVVPRVAAACTLPMPCASEGWVPAPHAPGLDVARCVATARVIMPRTVVRLSAGRLNFSFADQVGGLGGGLGGGWGLG